ncbi:MAG: hypothetical protein Kow00109_28260 [Acidobacteriota bacterium]
MDRHQEFLRRTASARADNPASPWGRRLAVLAVVFLGLLGAPRLRADAVTDEIDNLRALAQSMTDLPSDTRTGFITYLDLARQQYAGGGASPYSVIEIMEAFMTEFVDAYLRSNTQGAGTVSPQQDGDGELIDQVVASYFAVLSGLFFDAPETQATSQPLPEAPEGGCSAAILWRHFAGVVSDPGPAVEVPFGNVVQFEARTTAPNPTFTWEIGPWEELAFASQGSRASLFVVDQMTFRIRVQVTGDGGVACEDQVLVRGKGSWVD